MCVCVYMGTAATMAASKWGADSPGTPYLRMRNTGCACWIYVYRAESVPSTSPGEKQTWGGFSLCRLCAGC